MLKTDLIRVTLRERGRLIGARFYGRDAEPDHTRVNVSGFAARIIVEALAKAGDKGRAPSGIVKILRAAGFTDPQREFAFACDYLTRERLAGHSTTRISCTGNGRGNGGVVYRLVTS